MLHLILIEQLQTILKSDLIGQNVMNGVAYF